MQGGAALQAARHAADNCALSLAATIADRARRTIRQDTIDDHVGDVDAGAAKRPQTVFAFGDGQQLREKHPMKCRATGILEQRARPLRLPGQERNQAIGRFRAADARELLANQTMLALKPFERVGDRRDGVGGGQKTKRVAPSAPYRRRRGRNRRRAPAARSRAAPRARRCRESTARAAHRCRRDRARCRVRGPRRARGDGRAAIGGTRADRRAPPP